MLFFHGALAPFRRAGVGAAVSLMAMHSGRPRSGAGCEPEHVFRFGVIADVQYCDIDDGYNFGKTEHRAYRGSLDGARRAVAGFRAARAEPGGLAFVAQLGDLIDGQNAGAYGALEGRPPRSRAALSDVMAVLDGCPTDVPYYHCVGNHELYNFDSAALCRGPLNAGRHTIADDGGAHYLAFRPAAGWTVVVLDPYAVSAMQPSGTPGRLAAEALLRRHNPNPVLDGTPCNFFEGLEGPAMRFVPFNGGLGETQRAWLADALAAAKRRGDAVVVLTHLPLFHEAASWRNVAFDAPEALADIHAAGNVACVLAGHSHRGGFAVDAAGVAHCTVEATLTHETAFAVATCRADGSLHVAGTGSVPTRTFPPPRGL